METEEGAFPRDSEMGLETFLRGMETFLNSPSLKLKFSLETFLRGMETGASLSGPPSHIPP